MEHIRSFETLKIKVLIPSGFVEISDASEKKEIFKRSGFDVEDDRQLLKNGNIFAMQRPCDGCSKTAYIWFLDEVGQKWGGVFDLSTVRFSEWLY